MRVLKNRNLMRCGFFVLNVRSVALSSGKGIVVLFVVHSILHIEET